MVGSSDWGAGRTRTSDSPSVGSRQPSRSPPESHRSKCGSRGGTAGANHAGHGRHDKATPLVVFGVSVDRRSDRERNWCRSEAFLLSGDHVASSRQSMAALASIEHRSHASENPGGPGAAPPNRPATGGGTWWKKNRKRTGPRRPCRGRYPVRTGCRHRWSAAAESPRRDSSAVAAGGRSTGRPPRTVWPRATGRRG